MVPLKCTEYDWRKHTEQFCVWEKIRAIIIKRNIQSRSHDTCAETHEMPAPALELHFFFNMLPTVYLPVLVSWHSRKMLGAYVSSLWWVTLSHRLVSNEESRGRLFVSNPILKFVKPSWLKGTLHNCVVRPCPSCWAVSWCVGPITRMSSQVLRTSHWVW